MIVAEGETVGRQVERVIGLQWGRNLIVAEGWARWKSMALAACFNGAAT